MNKQYKIGDEVLVRGIVNSEVRNGGIHVLHDGVDAFYLLDQIHEPQKVLVPKFVAEWIEGCKRSGWHLEKVLHRLDDDEKVGDWAYDENDDLISEKVDMIARAWLDGYVIEQEKLYTVEIPNPNNTSPKYKLMLIKGINGVEILRDYYNEKRDPYIFQLTESEIKQDFEWAWQFAKDVEVDK
ncbi:DUF1642 domain-containing protein [Streptococcus suis]|uniref:DUF1642 domain-containing protein n=1 Tax=Streptococcus suis TaxID=1307 RepID=UPI001583C648|nr:DUF1642 domain-containing protein [Streptococcus suis]MCG9861945.1 DUF1642 domain-containing protein [Streptococcus suis]MCG9883298.1 DUF1642 domain-containing protein [Streptococcus suis]HEM6498905.1 DUF1642 domain-containing protein [Streptococcus suis]